MARYALRMSPRGSLAASLAVMIGAIVVASGCIGESPEQRDRAAQGEAEDGDEEHRPGQPCLVCHGQDYNPGDDVFAVAGTIYRSPSDPDRQGLEGASVSITDDDGRTFVALTNRVGNFMIEVESGIDQPRQESRGRLLIPWQPTFPLTVEIDHAGDSQVMESKIWREGSCAGCHRGSTADADSVEKVWLIDGEANQ